MIATTSPAAGTVALLLADARLPSGGHAHSSGLEPALMGGMPAELTGEFLLARARTTALVDAGTAVAARTALLGGGSLAEVERAWTARTPSAAMRAASRELGRGLARLARHLWGTSNAIAALESVPAPPRPLVLGAIAAATAIPADELARLAVYDDLAGAVAALLKLDPRDPADGAALVLAACASIEPSVLAVAAIRSPDQIPALSAPQAEAWAEQHATAQGRLFRG